MAEKRYTLVTFPQEAWEVHKPGCKEIKAAAALPGANKRLCKIDLDLEDDEVLDSVDALDDMTMEDVFLCACTGYEAQEETSTPPASSQPVHAAARASQEAARVRLQAAVEDVIEKLITARGEDNIGEGDEWSAERQPSCTDDYVYDLAVEVRKLRAKGESWWRVAYELGLPESGPSNKQGRKGGAFARRLWRAAWGKTYLGERGQRESKLTREVRAMANEGRPYFPAEATGDEVIKKVTGQMIHWVVRLENKHGLITSAQEAFVHDDPRLVKYRLGPQGPYIEFFEQLDPAMLMVDPRKAITKSGPLRAVYVDRITRVGA